MKYPDLKETLHISLRSILLVVMTVAFACAFATAAQFLTQLAAIVAVTLFAATFMLTAASLADDFWGDPGINFVAAILGMFTFPFLLSILLLLSN